MKPIQDIGEIEPKSVLYHSAFGFATVESVDATSVLLRWREESASNLPHAVPHDVVRRVYALCEEDGFFTRAIHHPDKLADLVNGQPVEALQLLLRDLPGPQTRADLVDWITRHTHLGRQAANRWWGALKPVIEEDERFRVEGEKVQLDEPEETGPTARLQNPALSAHRRLEVALANRDELEDDFFLEQVITAWRTGSQPVRENALEAVSDREPTALLELLLGPGPDGLDAVIHAIRRGGWGPDDVDPSIHAKLLDRIVKGCDAGGPLDHEGRLAATLARWNAPGVLETLTDLAATSDGRRLMRAAFASLPARRAEELGLDLLQLALESDDIDTATWLGGEILSIALVDQLTMADRLEDDHPEISEWFRVSFQGVEVRGLVYEDITDDSTAHTAEIELSDVVAGPIPLSRLPARSGASLLGLGLSMARALAQHHKDGTICNPTPERVAILPNETMEVTPGDRQGSPIPGTEEPSTTADVYAGAVLLLECLFGKAWPRTVPAQRVLPYLRYVVPQLPPAALAPLDAALHPDPEARPSDGLEWQAMWQVAAVAEEARTYASRDPAQRLYIGFDSHIGRAKLLLTQTNQDSVFVSSKGPLSLLVVCDGISTANAGSGDVASSIASHVIANLWDQALPRLVQSEPNEIREFLDRALRMANQAVCEAALRFAGGNLDGRVPMGSTAVVALVYGNRVWLAWLGDSRAYVVGNYGASLLTFDENQASERLRAWHLNFLEHWDPAGFALIGYLGHFDEMTKAEALPAHHTSFTLVPGERLVLCSDGVTDYLGDSHPEVAAAMAASMTRPEPWECARELVHRANRGGGGDNITAVVASLWEQ